jgi:hypothetical protein
MFTLFFFHVFTFSPKKKSLKSLVGQSAVFIYISSYRWWLGERTLTDDEISCEVFSVLGKFYQSPRVCFREKLSRQVH